jgi:hypothetical protein
MASKSKVSDIHKPAKRPALTQTMQTAIDIYIYIYIYIRRLCVSDFEGDNPDFLLPRSQIELIRIYPTAAIARCGD